MSSNRQDCLHFSKDEDVCHILASANKYAGASESERVVAMAEGYLEAPFNWTERHLGDLKGAYISATSVKVFP